MTDLADFSVLTSPERRAANLARCTPEGRKRYEDSLRNPRALRQLGLRLLRPYADAPFDSAGGPDVRSIEKIEIPGPSEPIPAALIVPEGEGPFGIYINLHAGGFIGRSGLGDLSEARTRASELDCVVVHPDFRVAPEHKYPATIDDCWAVTQWVFENAEAIGGDASRVGIGGGCTGGNFSAVMAIMCRDAGLPLAVQYLYFTIVDLRCDYASHFEFQNGYLLTRDSNLYVIEEYLEFAEQRFEWQASPILAPSLRGVAPARIVNGEFEILRDEMTAYANRLHDAGVEVSRRICECQAHGFVDGDVEQNVNRESNEFLRRFIGPLQ